jgi:hypothetical protein
MDRSGSAVGVCKDFVALRDQGLLPGSKSLVQGLQKLPEARRKIALAGPGRRAIQVKTGQSFDVFD